MSECPPELLGELEAVGARLARGSGRVHLLGICGVGMAGLAFHLKRRGFDVSGCDRAPGPLAAWLEARGIPVCAGHDPAHAAGADWLVRSAAVRPDHPELAAGLPVFRRGAAMAALLAGTKSAIVCGTHGKTTTTAMLVQALRAAGLDPAFCIGGESPALDGVAGAGSHGAAGALMVAEADESDGTLAAYAPDVGVVTNIEFDHAEHFRNLEELTACFAALAGRTRRLVYCADDPGARRLAAGHSQAVSFGIESDAGWRAARLGESADGSAFDVLRNGALLGRIVLPVPGRHNVLNALAVCAAAWEWGAGFEAMRRGLEGFRPASRRFERVVSADDILVISDYAHHPTEVASVLGNLKRMPRRRWRAVFQPHRYSRTRALGADFARVFKGLDELILLPVYAASEPELPGGTSWDLYALFRQAGNICPLCATSAEQAWAYLRRTLARGDGLLIIGAGDIGRMADWARSDLLAGGAAGLDPAPGWLRGIGQLNLASVSPRTAVEMDRNTTLHVGGKADIFLEIGNSADLAAIMRWAAQSGAPSKVLGGGSNVLASDLGVRGLVLRLAGAGFRGLRAPGKNLALAGGGTTLAALTAWAADGGLTGLEFLTGIPGTVGGALRMNAGAWGREMGGIVEWVRCLDRDGTERNLSAGELGFAYRQCAGLADKIVVEAALRVSAGRAADVRGRMAKIVDKRAWLAGRRSAGSIFKNPPGEVAGRLLELAGLKGRRVGGARVAGEHANVIVTEPGATASDVLALIGMARAAVRFGCGLELEEEIVCFE